MTSRTGNSAAPVQCSAALCSAVQSCPVQSCAGMCCAAVLGRTVAVPLRCCKLSQLHIVPAPYPPSSVLAQYCPSIVPLSSAGPRFDLLQPSLEIGLAAHQPCRPGRRSSLGHNRVETVLFCGVLQCSSVISCSAAVVKYSAVQ